MVKLTSPGPEPDPTMSLRGSAWATAAEAASTITASTIMRTTALRIDILRLSAPRAASTLRLVHELGQLQVVDASRPGLRGGRFPDALTTFQTAHPSSCVTYTELTLGHPARRVSSRTGCQTVLLMRPALTEIDTQPGTEVPTRVHSSEVNARQAASVITRTALLPIPSSDSPPLPGRRRRLPPRRKRRADHSRKGILV